jgi:hypothetical protein
MSESELAQARGARWGRVLPGVRVRVDAELEAGTGR